MDSANPLRSRLQEAPFNFLSSCSSSATLEEFDRAWQALRSDVDEAIRSSSLGPKDISLAHATAAQIATLGEGLTGIDNITSTMSVALVDDLEHILSQMTLHDTVDQLSAPSLRRQTPKRSSLLYIAPAYSWVVKNIHDPYPPVSVKRALAEEARVTVSFLNDWFKEVRRRIGWVSLCKDHFQGSRALAVEVAQQVFASPGGSIRCSPPILASFELMESRLRDLFPDEDTEDDRSSPMPWTAVASPSSSRTVSPTPSFRSWSSSSTPSLTFSSDDESDYSALEQQDSFSYDTGVATSSKRKADDGDDDNSAERCTKRQRSNSPDSASPLFPVGFDFDLAFTSSSPSFDFLEAQVTTPAAMPSSAVPSSTARKRRLSDAAAEWAAGSEPSVQESLDDAPRRIRRQRRASAPLSGAGIARPPSTVNRKQTVSSPFPLPVIADSSDDWFRAITGEAETAPAEPLSVDLFDWSSFANDTASFNQSLDAPLPSESSTVDSLFGDDDKPEVTLSITSSSAATSSLFLSDSSLESTASNFTFDLPQLFLDDTPSPSTPELEETSNPELTAFFENLLSQSPDVESSSEPTALSPSSLLADNSLFGLLEDFLC
ncbi:hypothetical protein EIP91_006160 [Steccherinum ochraceum]|uniref:KN homeodomain domain-containing protein n=1 Tax=Steccherinum ochraceum TaxID=92696 RepID=A0A4R0RGX9_9APHY|nr:hypothetical protein EIP91_006160 [Steccherinum ochraceum]